MIHFILRQSRQRESVMLQVKEAVQRAKSYLPELFFDSAAEGQVLNDLRLEEVELADDRKYWSVTFSYYSGASTRPIAFREYKTIKLNSADGEFVGVRNGMLASSAA